MTPVFHCYEFLLLKKLDEDVAFRNYVQELFETNKDRPVRIRTISPEHWFLGITLEKTRDRFPNFIRRHVTSSKCAALSTESLLTRYLNVYTFVELHLDSIFRYGEGGTLPPQLFKCTNLRALSLKYNFLESLPADIGRLQKLEYLALTNNRLQNSSIPRTLSFCKNIRVLFLDNNLLDALPGFLLGMHSLQTVHRHGNHNYFKATFMWYHTDFNDRILAIESTSQSTSLHPPAETTTNPTPSQPRHSTPSSPSSLQLLSAQAAIAEKINFFSSPGLPSILMDYIADLYHKFNICGNCPKAKLQFMSGYKVFTFKNPYLGNTCVPFQHWACSLDCAQAIEIPARIEQMLSSLEQDMEYSRYVRQAQMDKFNNCRHHQCVTTPPVCRNLNPSSATPTTSSSMGCVVL